MGKVHRWRFMAFLVPLVLMVGCGTANNDFGASVDISRICADSACANLASSLEASVFGNRPLTVYLEVKNNMKPGGTASGPTARIYMVQVDYLEPSGSPDIMTRVQEIPVNVTSGSTAIVPAAILSYEQLEFIRDRVTFFPDFPFQISCRITIFYNTTGGQYGSVERLLSVVITP
jgi:hypothetical protein